MGSEGGTLRELLAVFSFGVDTKELDKGKKKLGDFMGDIKKVAAAFAGGAIGVAIKNFAAETIDDMIAIRRGAQELRITTDEMQSLKSAGRALGMDVKWLHFSMERLQVSTELAARGSKRQATSMKLAGLEAKKANGEHKSASELFLDLADGLQKITDPAKRAIVVWDLFGRGGHRLLPMLGLGRQRLEELMGATKKYGQYSAEVIEMAARYKISQETLNLSFIGLKDTIMKTVIPSLEKGVIKTRDMVVWFNELAKKSQIGKAALYALSAVMTGLAIKMAIANPMVLALAAGFTALVVVLDDLLVWWNGGQSVMGEAIDALFGKGQSLALLKDLKDTWKQIGENIKWAWEELTGKGHLQEEAGPQQREFHGSDKEYADSAANELPWPFNRAVQFDVWNKSNTPGDKMKDMAAGFFGQPQWAHDYKPDGGGVSVGNLTVQVTAQPGADPRAQGVIAGQAAHEELQRQIRAAAAAATRRKAR